jgi:hypothetical protein
MSPELRDQETFGESLFVGCSYTLFPHKRRVALTTENFGFAF